MSFTKRHYTAIAEAIQESRKNAKVSQRADVDTWANDMAYALCPMFKQDNPRFKREKFLTAAGVPD